MINIYSFSFMHSDTNVINKRHSFNYVFDCRMIKNPGRIESLREKTGLDYEVIEYLEKETKIKDFIYPIQSIVSLAIDEYLEKKDRYEEVNIFFGCTGGKHRSVYSAEKVANFISTKYKQKVKIDHMNLRVVKHI